MKILILPFLLCVFSLYGQQNYVHYQQLITNAEHAILDSHYKEAVHLYDSLFRQYDFVFARHCYTACQTAVKAGDIDEAFYFIERGVQQGIQMEVIVNAPLLNELSLYQDKWEVFVLEYDSLREIYTSGVDWELRSKIMSLLEKDQKFTRRVNNAFFIWLPFAHERWKKSSRECVEGLTEIIGKEGFPGERLIGIPEFYQEAFDSSYWNKQKARIKEARISLVANEAFLMFVHYFSVPRPDSINKLLYAEMLKGNMEVWQYASLIDFQAEWGRGKYYKGLHYNQWHTSDDLNELERINEKRQAIGLESFEELRQKEERGLKICKERKQGNHRFIQLWQWCG